MADAVLTPAERQALYRQRREDDRRRWGAALREIEATCTGRARKIAAEALAERVVVGEQLAKIEMIRR